MQMRFATWNVNGFRAGSDHAMVVTDLILPDGPFVAAR